MDVLSFTIENGVLKEMMSGTTRNGKPWAYPNLSTFNREAFELIEDELKRTRSSKLKARYADFLWLAKKDDYKKAREAINSYLKLITEYEKSDLDNPNQHFGLDVLSSFKRALWLSKSVEYKKVTILQELKRLLFNFNPLSGSKPKLTIDLIRIALDNKKDITSKKFWNDSVKLCKEQSEKLASENNWHFSREFLLSAKKIEELVLKKKSVEWDRLIAEGYVLEADSHKAKKSFAKLHFLLKAIKQYEKINDQKKIEELKRRYEKSSKHIEFGEISTEIDVSEIIENAKRRAK